jgi:LEA14-like dessication related protein
MSARYPARPGSPGRRLRIPVLLAAAAVLAAACSPVTEISAPLITLEEVEVRSFSGGIADLSLVLTLINQNSFEITLVELTGALSLDEHEVGPIHWTGEFDCAKRDTTAMRVPVRLTVGTENEIYHALIDRRPLGESVTGEVTIARGVIRRTYPVTLTRHPGDVGR